MATLKLKNINKVYPNGVHAVCNFDVEIEDKEFIVLVGPSGCGKSTVLRMISGLENISRGEFWIDDLVVNLISPADRDISMVFQSYALYPHMTVFDNVAFSLKLRKIDKFTISDKVKDAAKKLGLSHLLSRKPKELSGGQRQRVALARSIVRKPKIFLMDEPLSNLDAALRQEMRIMIKNLHRDLETNIFYVTHDQIEAMTMADRIIVMNDGFIQQVGKPDEIFLKPANLFVAKFIGTPQINLINGIYKNGNFIGSGFNFKVPKTYSEKLSAYEDKEIILGVRPTDIQFNEATKMTYPETIFKLKVENEEVMGSEVNLFGSHWLDKDEIKKVLTVKIPFYEFTIMNNSNSKEIEFSLDLNKIHFFDPETTLNITVENNMETEKAILNFTENEKIRNTRSSLMTLQKYRDASKLKLSQLYSNFTKLENTEHDKAKLEYKKSKLQLNLKEDASGAQRIDKNIKHIEEKINQLDGRISQLQTKQEHIQGVNFAKNDLRKYYSEKIEYNNFLLSTKINNNNYSTYEEKTKQKNKILEYKKSLIFNEAKIPKFQIKFLLSPKFYKAKKMGMLDSIGFNYIKENAKAKTNLKERLRENKIIKTAELNNQNNKEAMKVIEKFNSENKLAKQNYKLQLKENKEKFLNAKAEYVIKLEKVKEQKNV